jgi:PAS domain S-box-containing protein
MAPSAVLSVLVLGGLWVAVPQQRDALALTLGLTLVVFAAIPLPWHRWPDSWQAAPSLFGFAPIAALDYALGTYYFAVLPIIWLALFFNRWVMLAGIGLFTVTVPLPRLLFPAAYPDPDLSMLWVVTAVVAAGGLGAQSLVSSARNAIAEAKAATSQARADRDMVNAYLDNIGALVVVLDPTGRVLLFNRFMEEATGARTADVIGQFVWDPTDGDDASQQSFQRVLAGESPVVVESVFPTLKGETLVVNWSTTALTDEKGNVTRVISVGLDVTAQRAAEAATLAALEREKQAAERLRDLDRSKSDFVATVSHDLRTPLTSIIGNTELLLDGDAGEIPPLQQKLIATVDRNARRLDTLVGDLLLLSRVESGTMRLDLRPVAIREVIDGALEALAAKLSDDIALEVEAPAEPVLVQGDLDQLERVTTNLVGNALKFTPPGGRVEICVAPDPEQVRLQIRDTGMGIPEDELPYVFDRFYRSSRSQKKGSPGTGLGLTIVKSIVDLHHGTIEAAANPGGGTVFTITLPRLAAMADEREKKEYA